MRTSGSPSELHNEPHGGLHLGKAVNEGNQLVAFRPRLLVGEHMRRGVLVEFITGEVFKFACVYNQGVCCLLHKRESQVVASDINSAMVCCHFKRAKMHCFGLFRRYTIEEGSISLPAEKQMLQHREDVGPIGDCAVCRKTFVISIPAGANVYRYTPTFEPQLRLLTSLLSFSAANPEYRVAQSQ